MRSRVLSWCGLLTVAAVLFWQLWIEPPVGRISGRVLLPNGKPLANTRVWMNQDPGVGASRWDITDSEGRFAFRRAPAGKVEVTVGSRWHTGEGKGVVREARETEVVVRLVRDDTSIEIAGSRQSVFTTDETPRIPITAYADGPGIRVSLWKQDPARFLGRAAAFDLLERLNSTWEKPLVRLPAGQAPTGAPDVSVVVPFGKTDSEGHVSKRIAPPLPADSRGLWLARLSTSKGTLWSWILVTNLAVVVKRPDTDAQGLAYVVDQRTGRPVAGAEVTRTVDGIADRFATRSGPDGTAWLPPVPGKEGRRLMVVATRGGDVAMLRETLWSEGTPAERHVVHLQTDRPIYRPGHVIRYKGTVRAVPDPANRARYAVPAPTPVDIALVDPTGVEVARTRGTTSPAGTFHGEFATNAEAPTGGYSVQAKVDGATGRVFVPVSSYRKPEMSLAVTADRDRALSTDTISATIRGAYYHGMPLAGAKVRWSVNAEADWSAEMLDRSFGDAFDDVDPSTMVRGEYYGEVVASGSGTLGPDGKLTIRFGANANREEWEDGTIVPPPQSRTFTIVANLDDDERSVSGEDRVAVTTAEGTVALEPDGYLAAPGKPSRVIAMARDVDGNPLPGASVRLEVAHLVHVAETEWDAPTTKRVPIGAAQEATTGPDGRVSFAVVPTRSGRFECVATLTTSGGRTARTTTELYASSDRDESLETASGDLSLWIDRKWYRAGDTARVMIGAEKPGPTALLTVESDRLLKVISVPLRSRTEIVRIPLPASYGPNVTVSVCTVRDKHFAEARESLRMASPDRALRVRVEPDRAEARPGDTVGCTVVTTDLAGRPVPADFSLAVVDEGVHALRADDPRSMRRTFYPFRWWSIATHHSFEIGYLDGEDKTTPAIKPRTRFLDTAYWLPDGRTGADGTARLKVPLPDNLTSWRFTVRAATLADTRVGSGRVNVRATKPLALRLELPRLVGVGDRSRVVAMVDNGTGRDQDVSVRLPAAGLFGGGDPVQRVRIPAGRTGSVHWDLRPETAADLTLQCTAWTKDRAHEDGAVSTLTVRPFGRQVRWSSSGTMENGEARFAAKVPEGDVPGERSLVVRVATGIADPLAAAARYLVEYPYGCTEQTMSRALGPALAARAVPGVVAADAVRATADRAIARLRRFQHPTGGWGWWEHGDDDPFLTAYVLHGLLDLRAAGAAVPDAMVGSAADAVRVMAKAGKPVGRYGHWAMARAGRPLGGVAAPKAKATVRDLASDILRLAAEQGDASSHVAALKRRVRREGPLCWWSDREPDAWDPDSSERMDTAIAVRALLAVDPDDRVARAAIRWLLVGRTGDSFGDTRDTAAVVAALADWGVRHPGARGGATRIVARVGGTPVPVEGVGGERIVRVPSRLLRSGDNAVRIQAVGGDPSTMFWSAVSTGWVAPAGDADLPPVSPSAIVVGREYLANDRPTDRFAAGDDVVVRLTIETTTRLHHAMLEEVFPAGFEPTERGSAEIEPDMGRSNAFWDYADVRDDRVALFFRTLDKGKHVFLVHLKAVTPGRYRVPPATLTPMYREALRAESRGSRVEVSE